MRQLHDLVVASGTHTNQYASSYFPEIDLYVNNVDSSENDATINVTDSHLTVSADVIPVFTGQTFTGTVGTFTDSHDPTTANATAYIDWGDGSSLSAGVVHSLGE